MTVYTYDRITRQVTKKLPCPVCGKRLHRQRTFGQTVNPFNKNADGTQKTSTEVAAAVSAQAKAWQTQPETCATHATEETPKENS